MRGHAWTCVGCSLVEYPTHGPQRCVGLMASGKWPVRELMPGGVHLASLQRLVRVHLPVVFLKGHKVKL